MKALIEDGAPVQTILDQVGRCRRTYFNYRDNLKQFGTVLAPGISKIGRPSILTSEMVEVHPMFWPELVLENMHLRGVAATRAPPDI
jgi:hypothetical protein